MIKLIGIVIVVVGLILRYNALLVVLAAGFATGLVAGMSVTDILEATGKAFITNRYMSLFILILPIIGVLERYGMREQAENLIRKMQSATCGRILIVYMLFRQITLAFGLQLGGHPSFIRPLISPMAEAAAAKNGELSAEMKDKIRGMSAASENFGNFFGQQMFIAAGGLLLIKGVMEQAGLEADLLTMAKYAVPTAVAALILSFIRFTLFDRSIIRSIAAEQKSSREEQK